MKIAIGSGKGGTGKTFVATNLFYTLKHANEQVILVDCDVEVPNAKVFFPFVKTKQEKVTKYHPVFNSQQCTYCGKCLEYCEFNAIYCIPEKAQIRLFLHLCHGCKACAIACNQKAITDAVSEVGIISYLKDEKQISLIEGKMNEGELSSEPVIKQTMKRASELHYDYMVIDAAPGSSCAFIQTASRSYYVILVTEPTPFGLSDLRQAIETLKIIKKPFGVIINRSGLGNKDIYLYLKEQNIPLLAEIPFDKKIAEIYSEGKLTVNCNSKVKKIKETFRLSQKYRLMNKWSFQWSTEKQLSNTLRIH